MILWKPVLGIGHRGRGRPRSTFVDNLLIDTGVETTGKLETLMLDRMVMWRRVILDPRAVKKSSVSCPILGSNTIYCPLFLE